MVCGTAAEQFRNDRSYSGNEKETKGHAGAGDRAALDPGTFIGHGADYEFVESQEATRTDIDALIDDGQRAVDQACAGLRAAFAQTRPAGS